MSRGKLEKSEEMRGQEVREMKRVDLGGVEGMMRGEVVEIRPNEEGKKT